MDPANLLSDRHVAIGCDREDTKSLQWNVSLRTGQIGAVPELRVVRTVMSRTARQADGGAGDFRPMIAPDMSGRI